MDPDTFFVLLLIRAPKGSLILGSHHSKAFPMGPNLDQPPKNKNKSNNNICQLYTI